MATTPKSVPPSSAGDDRNLVTVDENYLAPTFEDRLRMFWERNSRAVIIGCLLVLTVILGKGAYEYLAAQRAQAVADDYASARAAGDAQLKTFVDANAEHSLAGIAQLELADKAYLAGNYADARGAYDKAAAVLKNTTFGQRARLGAAISAVQAGLTSDGEAALKQLAADLNLGKLVRSEAAYHLAALAAQAGNSAEAIRYIEQSTAIDPEGHWADRASMLRATLPTTSTTEPTTPNTETPTPSVSFK